MQTIHQKTTKKYSIKLEVFLIAYAKLEISMKIRNNEIDSINPRR